MEKYVLEAEKRDIIGKKVKALRREGKLPAIIYGQDIEPMPITLDNKQVIQTLKMIGANTLVTIKVGKEEFLALVRDIQREVIRRDLLHLDFQAVSLDEKITSSVPIVTVGESVAVKEFDALLITSLDELQIEAKAKDLPDTIAVDISSLLEIGDNILVKDIEISGEVTLLHEPEEIVIVATAPTLMDEIEDEIDEEGELFEELTDAELMDEDAEEPADEGGEE